MYRFLLTPRWLAAAALAVAAAVVMVMLGNWQLHRYQERSAINARIDAADSTEAVPMTSVMAAPTAAGSTGASPGKRLAWTKVTVSGRYDVGHEIQARGRTVDGDVGFEIVTPLLLDDGTAVLVDRGWVPAPAAGATAAPVVPAAPTGSVTVVGQIHLSESRPTPIEHRDGRLDTRRISVPRIAHEMPFPVYGAYLLLTTQMPAADPAFSQVPIDHEDSWQNGGYAVQWWLFAGMALFAFGWQARKEAHGDYDSPEQDESAAPAKSTAPGGSAAPVGSAASMGSAAPAGSVASVGGEPAVAGRTGAERPRADRPLADRVAEADRKRGAPPAAIDRVAEADRKRAARQEPIDRVEEADRKRAAAGPTPIDQA